LIKDQQSGMSFMLDGV